VINYKVNCDFKSHIIFRETEEEQNINLWHYSRNTIRIKSKH
jgi:hypothetical protein